MSKVLSRASISGLVLCLFIDGQALAADATQVADAIVAAVGASGENKATYESATAAGDDVTITGYKMIGTKTDAATGAKTETETMTVPTLVVSGAQPRDKGGFTATKITFDGATLLSDGNTITWQTGSATEATIPSPDEIKAKAKLRPFTRADLGALTISGGDLAAPMNIGSVGVGIDVEADGTPKDFTLDVNAIAVPGELFSDPQQKAVLDALGYTNFTINVGVAGGYETATDTLTMRTFTIDTGEVGKLSIEGKFSGVSLSKLSDQETAKDVASTGKIDALTIRFDNAGIVERVLDMQAKMMGATREDVVAQVGGALPLMLNAVGNPPFQDKVAAAAQAFLKDPKSLTITIAPTAPVSFEAISTAATTAPNTLPDLLVVDVTANN
jgi:hypothetical protein